MKRKNVPIREEESLRRSHSGFSNFKLTLICLLCAVSVTVLTASVATFGTSFLSGPVPVVGCIAGGLFTLVSICLIIRFKR